MVAIENAMSDLLMNVGHIVSTDHYCNHDEQSHKKYPPKKAVDGIQFKRDCIFCNKVDCKVQRVLEMADQIIDNATQCNDVQLLHQIKCREKELYCG